MAELWEDAFAITFVVLAFIAYLIGGTWPFWGKKAMAWFTDANNVERKRRFYHGCQVLGLALCLMAMASLATVSTYLGTKKDPIRSAHVIVAVMEAIVSFFFGVMAGLQFYYVLGIWSAMGLTCASLVFIYKVIALACVAHDQYMVQVLGSSAAFFTTVGAILPYYEAAWDAP